MACSHSDTIAYCHICPVYEGGSNMENSAVCAVSYHTCAGAQSMVEVLYRVEVICHRDFKEKTLITGE